MTKNLDLLHSFNLEGGLFRIGGNVELYEELIIDFFTEFQNTVQEFNNYFNEKQYEDARRIIHTVKGVSGNLGITELHISAAELEKAVKEMQLDDIANLLINFENILNKVLMEIKSSGITEKESQNNASLTLEKDKAVTLFKEFQNQSSNRKAKQASDLIKEILEYKWNPDISSLIEETAVFTRKYKLKEASELSQQIIRKLEGE